MVKSTEVELYFNSFLQGEEEGFTFFFKLYFRALVFFSRRLKSREPEELVSDCFMKVWSKRESIQSATGLKGYLYTTVYRESIRSRTGSQHAVWVLNNDGDEETSFIDNDRNALDQLLRTELLCEVYQAIEELPQACRQVFVQLFIDGKSVKDISGETGLSVSTIKTHKARALAFLKSRITPADLLLFILSSSANLVL
ncbi:MAG: sigma-70 family RNA polymerase sigma factor [Sphingobacteriales bacterium]|nr:sigma-70 family RNA polymerase sigma factor [Sphingobacteriales bacterium]